MGWFFGWHRRVFDGQSYLASHHGPLLDDLRDPDYFWRCFIDADALDDSIWAALDKHCCWNLLTPIDTDVCTREGTRKELERLRQHWMRRYGQWQRRAVTNGRYFPPPWPYRRKWRAPTRCHKRHHARHAPPKMT